MAYKHASEATITVYSNGEGVSEMLTKILYAVSEIASEDASIMVAFTRKKIK